MSLQILTYLTDLIHTQFSELDNSELKTKGNFSNSIRNYNNNFQAKTWLR